MTTIIPDLQTGAFSVVLIKNKMMKKKTIFIICSVKDADEELKKRLVAYAEYWEKKGYVVHLPHRDTVQEDPTGGHNIMNTNVDKILDYKEIHIFYDHGSHGSKADIGTVWACLRLAQRKGIVGFIMRLFGLSKKIVLVNRNEVVTPPEMQKKNHFKALCYYIDHVQNPT